MPASKDVTSNAVATMSDADKIAAFDALQAQSNGSKAGPPRFKVVVSDPAANGRVLFSSVSKSRAKTYVEQKCPRGQHFHVAGPDGELLGYEAERATGVGPDGEDLDMWQEFDPEAYSSPELNPVNSHDPWADAWEGAQ
jgi:hypothetical protein